MKPKVASATARLGGKRVFVLLRHRVSRREAFEARLISERARRLTVPGDCASSCERKGCRRACKVVCTGPRTRGERAHVTWQQAAAASSARALADRCLPTACSERQAGESRGYIHLFGGGRAPRPPSERDSGHLRMDQHAHCNGHKAARTLESSALVLGRCGACVLPVPRVVFVTAPAARVVK